MVTRWSMGQFDHFVQISGVLSSPPHQYTVFQSRRWCQIIETWQRRLHSKIPPKSHTFCSVARLENRVFLLSRKLNVFNISCNFAFGNVFAPSLLVYPSFLPSFSQWTGVFCPTIHMHRRISIRYDSGLWIMLCCQEIAQLTSTNQIDVR